MVKRVGTDVDRKKVQVARIAFGWLSMKPLRLRVP